MERNIFINWEEVVKEAIKRRKEQKISQEQFSVLIGISKPTINRFERGDYNISFKNIAKILKALNLMEN